MGAWLNTWEVEFAARTPDALHSATFFPEPGADGYVAEAIGGGARPFKAHPQGGGCAPRGAPLHPGRGPPPAAAGPPPPPPGAGAPPGRPPPPRPPPPPPP